MWERGYLKSRAKAVLRVSYWKAFLISLVIAFVGGNSGGGGINFNWNMRGRNSYGTSASSSLFGSDLPPAFLLIFLVVILVIIFVVLAFRIFLGYPLEVGGRRYFTQAAQYNINMNYLGFSFERNRYFNIIKTMLWRSVLTFLWFLLLIIPGIVKSYAYSMVPYILADNPNIGSRRAIEISNRMTDGEKIRLWVLDLSFIGWYLLGTLALLVGVLFVHPYVNATKAELYLVLRQNALDQGICSYDELLIQPPEKYGGAELV